MNQLMESVILCMVGTWEKQFLKKARIWKVSLVTLYFSCAAMKNLRVLLFVMLAIFVGVGHKNFNRFISIN